MKAATLDEYYNAANQQLPRRSAVIVMELVEEIRRLQRLTLKKGLHPIGAEEPWPYNPHAGVPLAECPEDYLINWMNCRNREALLFDVEYAVIAQRDLRLYDYIRKISTPPKLPETETRNDQAPVESLPQAEAQADFSDGNKPF